jgi:transcriptional regulator with XRE-family HTH domain
MIAKLMVIQGISQRTLAAKAGYKSHAYMGRILRGEVKTLDPDAAVRIAKHLGVGVDDLFLVRVSSDGAHSAERRPA